MSNEYTDIIVIWMFCLSILLAFIAGVFVGWANGRQEVVLRLKKNTPRETRWRVEYPKEFLVPVPHEEKED